MHNHIHPAARLLLLSCASVCAVSACIGDARDQTLIVGIEQSAVGGGGNVASAPMADASPTPDAASTTEPTPIPKPVPPTRHEPDEPFTISIRDARGARVSQLSLPCGSTQCVELEAVAEGGTPPIQLRWEDGSSASTRRVCPTSSMMLWVIAREGVPQSPEQALGLRTSSAQLALQVATCPADAGVAPVLAPNACKIEPGPRCDLGMGESLPEDVTVNLFAQPQYFVNGAALPAGRYRLTYIDGCNTYGIGVGWSVHAGITSGDAVSTGLGGCYLLGADGVPFVQTPGTEIWPPSGEGQTQTYKQCVALNCKLPSIDFDFAGGKLAVRRDGGGELGAIDDSGGGQEGGRNPTFRLSRLSACATR